MAMLRDLDQQNAEIRAIWIEVETSAGEEKALEQQASKLAEWRQGIFTTDSDEARNMMADYVSFRVHRTEIHP